MAPLHRLVEAVPPVPAIPSSLIRTCRSSRATLPASGRRTAMASAAAAGAAIAVTAASAWSSPSSRRPARQRSSGTFRRTAAPRTVTTRRRIRKSTSAGVARSRPALGNDTYGTCNPMGMPRAALYPDPVELIVLPDRILQHFQWGYGLRTIWMDGRKLPAPEDIDIPRWWGYAVGRWEGNTLVVESTGYDERTWIDHFGYPHSDEMVLRGALHAHQLRHHRVEDDADRPEVLHEALDGRDQTHAPAAEDVHPVVGMGRRCSRISARRPTNWSSTGSFATRRAPASRPSLERDDDPFARSRLVRRRGAGMSDGVTLAGGSPRHAGVSTTATRHGRRRPS